MYVWATGGLIETMSKQAKKGKSDRDNVTKAPAHVLIQNTIKKKYRF